MPQESLARARELRGDVVTCSAATTYVELAAFLERNARGAAQPLVDAARLGDGRDRELHARLGRRQRQSDVRRAVGRVRRRRRRRARGASWLGGAAGNCARRAWRRLLRHAETQPSYRIRQDRYTGLPWASVDASFDALMSCASSVSLFTRWDASGVQQARPRAARRRSPRPRATSFSAEARVDAAPHGPGDGPRELHAAGRARRLERAAAPLSRRMPAVGGRRRAAERVLCGERACIAGDAGDALGGDRPGGRPALRRGAQHRGRRLPGARPRTAAPSSPSTHVDVGRGARPIGAAPRLEAALAPFDAVPHRAHYTTSPPARLCALYGDRLRRWAAVARRVDPAGKFRNEMLASSWRRPPTVNCERES